MSNWFKKSHMIEPFRRSLEHPCNHGNDPIIKRSKDKGYGVYERDGSTVEEGFRSCEEAQSYYPEGEVQDA